MKYYILQMPVSLWKSELFTENISINLKDYCRVYCSNLNEDYPNMGNTNEILNYIFEDFNNNHPKHFAGRSLSVGDIVFFREELTNKNEYYLCRSIGFTKIEF